MKKVYSFILSILCCTSICTFAQQLPNADFEDWSAAAFDGNAQPASWNASNVTQFGFKFNFAHKEAGHTGSASMMVQDQEVGALGITEVSPGYFSLGQPWVYIQSLTATSEATAGTEGGVSWAHRPDTMSVWIKRTGSNVTSEDFYLLYYAWTGTAKSSKYKGKNGNCTSVSKTNEESDIRLALDGNECGTDTKANQVAEGMWREKKEYANWTNIRVPIYYMNSDVPTMMNIIFSASNYPNFRANSGLYAGNSLYIDDIELIYSSHIQKLYIDGKEWKGFNPNSSEEQIYSLGRNATSIPSIKAARGAGSLTNARGTAVQMSGRELTDSEISITNGTIDGTPTLISVAAEDGSSTTTYKIKFVREPSTNSKLAGITINGKDINTYNVTFNPSVFSYTVTLPYGTTAIPQIAAEGQEDEQTISVKQPTSLSDNATIQVTAADKKTISVYTIRFEVALLSDNTLKDILINGESLSGFTPYQTTYRVSLPTSTTTMPTVKAVSAYPDGEQTIEYVAPSVIDGGTYLIKVTTPGNPVVKTYKLNIKLEASTYSLLKDLQVGDGLINDFTPETKTYYINLPIGTTELPAITWTKGESTQEVTIQQGGLDGTTKIIVTAGDQVSQTEYKIVFSTAKSEITTLQMIYIGGTALEGFSSDKTTYAYSLPIGTTTLPEITVDKGDQYETVTILNGGINGTTRITVVAGNGNSTLYQITFSVQQATDATLRGITIDGTPLTNFDPNILEYDYILPQGTTTLPSVTYTPADQYQQITVRSSDINGDYKITVRPQTGASRTYVIHFSVKTSSNTSLSMIYLDGQPLANFAADTLEYIDSLPIGETKLPNVTYDKAETSQRVLSVCSNNTQTLKVTAENGSTRTYTILFVIQRSESAYLQMIYLDGQPLAGFDKQQLTYDVPLTTTTCPVITVDKEPGQQVTITVPYAAGTAEIEVKPEGAASNTYTINFTQTTSNKALLSCIYADGQRIPSYDSTTFEYTLTYTGATIPTITYDATAAQQVSVFQNNDDITLLVSANTDKAQYTLHLSKTLSTTCQLQSIDTNGVQIAGFSPDKHDYILLLPAGAQQPQITYTKGYDAQVTYAGQQNDSLYTILVEAENGDTTRYNVHINISDYDNANLLDLQVDGHNIHFSPTTYTYDITLADGIDIPAIHAMPDQGQSTVTYTLDSDEQQVIVTTPSGKANTYKVLYTRIPSTNALLSDILVGGKSLKGFRSDIYAYTDTLAWRTQVVPCVQPIGQEPNNQTITTYHSAINGTTRIHVVAGDGHTSQDYTIYFPVRQSGNVALQSLMLNSGTVTIDFDPDSIDYQIQMPYGENETPDILYEVAEAEQQVQYISRPLGQTSQIIVTAENGDTRTYNILFTKTYASADNTLTKLSVQETGEQLNVTQADHSVTLPYGTRTLTVDYTKAFPEQTVWVQSGGITYPTIITVKSNRPEDPDRVYTLTPQVQTQYPAFLNGITVDGTAVPNFDANRLTYIVNRSNTSIPNVTYTTPAGVQCTPYCDMWHWTATVTTGTYSRTYTIFFHYTNSVIPNGEFDQWTTTTSSKSAKPTSWNTPGDYINTYLGTAKAGPTVSKDGTSAVHLKTSYWVALAGPVPAVINLGEMSASFAVAGGTRVTASGSIGFFNTPDSATINYKYTSHAGNGALFQFKFFDNNKTEYTFDHTQTSTGSTYADKTIALATDQKNISSMDIIIDATGQYPGASSGADLYVDYIRFAYNSTLTALSVNGINATLTGNAFTATLTDSEDTAIPQLTFTGEVSDQAQHITWQSETTAGKYGIRRATITNYAEDDSSTPYTLEVKRPLDTQNTLQDILLDGVQIASFAPTTTEYTVHLTSADNLPDIYAVPQSSLQAIKCSYADSTYTILVTPEYGESTTYTIRFVTDLSTDTQLASITATGITFAPDQTEYTISASQLPTIKFHKKSDSQTVNLQQGVLTVTAESGAISIYTIALNPPTATTTGQLSKLEIDEVELQSFSSDVYTYTLPRPDQVAFERTSTTDSVIFVQTPTDMQWQVFGTEQHTYTLTYPVTLSSNTYLDNILRDNTPLADFDKQIYQYTIQTDQPVHLQAIANASAQQLTTTHDTTNNANAFIFTVTAEDGTVGTPYRVDIQPNLTSTPYLSDILLDGHSIDHFRSDSLQYTVILPTGAYKTAEPTLPSLSYELSAPRQHVEVESGKLGQATYIHVTSEDGTQDVQYEVLISAEPSHNASLTGIAVNGEPISSFQPGRHYYSEQTSAQDIVLSWSAQDCFQTVTLSNSDIVYTLHVIAQDGTTTADYVIEVYQEEISDDATLSDIRLNGQTFDSFYPSYNPSLEFAPMQQLYTINLPAGTTDLPVVSAIMREAGQEVNIRKQDQWVYIDVTAADKVTTNTYKLQFNTPKSSNADLKMIYVNGDTLTGFAPDKYTYFISLPIGQNDIPDIYAELSETSQTKRDSLTAELQQTIYVTAEDGTTHQYMLAFTRTLSQTDTLLAIYADGLLLQGFAPHTYYYSYTLPVGTSHIPDLTWDEGDKWQTINSQVVSESATTRTTQIQVVAMSGHKNTYTIAYQIEQSSIDTLQMIYIQGDSLQSFMGTTHEYTIALTPGDSIAPTVTWLEADNYQTVTHTTTPYTIDGQQLGWRQTLTVSAQNGQSRTYTLYFTFSKVLSTEVGLRNIYVAGEALSDFTAEQFIYHIYLTEGQTLPNVIAEPIEMAQTIVITSGETTRIDVTAEDTTQHATYTLIFHAYQSPYALLSNIYMDNEPIDGFQAEVFEYNISLPYGTTELPTFTYLVGEQHQQVAIDTFSVTVDGQTQTTLRLTVTAQDPVYSSEYDIHIVIERNNDCRLRDLRVKGETIADFSADSLTYTIVYPINTDSAELATAEQLQAFAMDEQATVNIITMGCNFNIQVTAADGKTTRNYIVYQQILLSSNARLQAIYLDSVLIRDFDPETLEYTYYITDVQPSISAVPEDDKAEVDMSMFTINQPFYIYVTAPDGTEEVYTIYFLESTIQTSRTPRPTDVMMKHIQGTMDVAFATIRKNVSVGVFSDQGALLFYADVPETNQNDAVIATNAEGTETLIDVQGDAVTYTLPDVNLKYIYVFFENNKRRIASGKIAVLR